MKGVKFTSDPTGALPQPNCFYADVVLDSGGGQLRLPFVKCQELGLRPVSLCQTNNIGKCYQFSPVGVYLPTDCGGLLFRSLNPHAQQIPNTSDNMRLLQEKKYVPPTARTPIQKASPVSSQKPQHDTIIMGISGWNAFDLYIDEVKHKLVPSPSSHAVDEISLDLLEDQFA